MNEEEVKARIEELKSSLTGNLFSDGETMQEIYDLKKQLNPEIENNPELDDDDDLGCIYCSG